MRRTAAILIILLLISLAFTGCKKPMIATPKMENTVEKPKTEASDRGKQISAP